MTHHNDYNLSAGTIDELTRNGLDGVPEMMRILLDSVMQAERAKYLRAGEYERTEERKGHANGYKPKTVRTRVGEISLAIPQVREGGFYPSALEKGLRSEMALVTILAEMYVQGVSTRKVKAVFPRPVRVIKMVLIPKSDLVPPPIHSTKALGSY